MYWAKGTDRDPLSMKRTTPQNACEEPEVCSVEYACLLLPPLSAQYEVEDDVHVSHVRDRRHDGTTWC